MALVVRICQQCGKSYETDHEARSKYCSQACYGLSRRRGAEAICAFCGKTFYKLRSQPRQRYCSPECGHHSPNMRVPDASQKPDIHGSRNPMYGRGMKGADNPMYGLRTNHAPRWTGGVHHRRDGYRYAVAADNHPNPAYVKPSGTKYVLLHRQVMERHLGRFLTAEEVVHHRDGDPTNNEIENLQLFASQADHIRLAHGDQGVTH
jgi:HNH endonuclease